MKNKENAIFAKAGAQDIPTIVALEQSLNQPQSWGEKMFSKLVKDKNWTILVARLGGQVVGYLVGQVVGDEAELHDISVVPEHRRQGIGRLLMERFLASTGAAKVFLLVRASNQTAQKFYQQLGFQQTGIRKDYYQSPSEDARVFCGSTQ